MAKADVELVIKADDKASGKLQGISNKMQGMSSTFRKAGIGMMGVGVALGGGLIALGKTAADFEMAMREVNTMIGLSDEGFQALSDQVHDLSSEVGKSSIELSGALYQIVSAGIDAADAIYVLEVASKAAVAGVTDVETAADGLTTVLNAFKIPAQDAGKVADIMFTVVKRGKTNFEELSAAIFQVAPIAATAGVKFEEVAAAVATVTKQGVPTKVATVQLRQAIQSIIKPTTDMRDAISNMGYASGEAMLAELGMAGSLNAIRDSAGGSLESLGMMFGSVEALGAVLGLTGENAATFAEDITATTEGAAGSVESAYEEMNKGVGRQFEILFNDIKVMGEEIGAALLPIFKMIIEKIKPIIEAIKNWVEANKELIPLILALAAVLGVGGAILIAFSYISKAIIAINVALAIMHGLMGPAGWIKLAAGLAIAGGAVFAITQMTKMQEGGIVTRPTTALIGEGGPEAVVPLGRAGGFGETNVYVTVQGSVITEDELSNIIYEKLLMRKGRNYSLELA